MFVPHDKNVTRRFFQKPNILRKNPRSVPSTKLTEATQIQIIVPPSVTQELNIQEHSPEKNTKHKCSKPSHGLKKPAQWVLVDNYVCDDYKSNKTVQSNVDTNEIAFSNLREAGENSVGHTYHNTGEKCFGDDNVDHTSLQIGNTIKETNGFYVTTVGNAANGAMLSYINFDDSDKGIESYNYNIKDLSISHIQEVKNVVGDNVVLSNNVTDICIGSNKEIVEGATVAKQSHMISNDISSFKCDVLNCNKLFDSEEKLKKHKSSHNKRSGQRPLKQAVECPVKNLGIAKDESCGRIYLNREELMKHLNEDHTIDQASHKCDLCERRFFWLTGLRAHGRSHTNSRVRKHVCPWPGCSRVFMQACRLKEHTRAHTGDRPYACQYPDCGWSFRTASKLVRHARQHTGERRHVCTECGRRFLRPEHLRDHILRHAHPHLRPRHACNVHGCEQSFINMSSLYHHIRKVHQIEENKKLDDTTVELTFPVDNEPDWTIVDNTFSLSNEDDTSGPEWHAARTHCTWPLAPVRPSGPTPPVYSSGENAEDNGDTTGEAYVVDSNDVQVELFDNSDSNIYTVRSDLFLHANAIHSEDSEGVEGPSGACDDGLELVLLPPPTLDLDPPPSHLMQEELMYADTVDESSFQVLLLNGDEIN